MMLTRYTENGRKGQHEKIDEPTRMQEMAHHTWLECYPVGDHRDIVRQLDT